MYRIGFPLWTIAARLGIRLSLRVDVVEDTDAGVYIGTSNDLPGLVCEATDIEALTSEIHATARELLETRLQQSINAPVANLRFA
jgi:hypothetical protein